MQTFRAAAKTSKINGDGQRVKTGLTFPQLDMVVEDILNEHAGVQHDSAYLNWTVGEEIVAQEQPQPRVPIHEFVQPFEGVDEKVLQ